MSRADSCEVCKAYETEQNRFPRLLARFFVALWGIVRSYFWPTQPYPHAKAPRFYCLTCKTVVPAKQVVARGMLRSSAGPVDEAFLGTEYIVTCHGQEYRREVTYVAEMLDYQPCHVDVSKPTVSPRTPEQETELREQYRSWREENIARVQASPEHQRNVEASVAAVHRANEQRTAWERSRDLSEVLSNAQSIAAALPFYSSDRPGEMTEGVADAVEADMEADLKVAGTRVVLIE